MATYRYPSRSFDKGTPPSQIILPAASSTLKTGSTTDTATAAEVATRLATFLRSISDSSAFANVATRLAVLLRSVTDATTFSEVATQIATLLRSTTDTAHAADSVARIFAGARASTDSAAFAQVATRLLSLTRTGEPITDAIALWGMEGSLSDQINGMELVESVGTRFIDGKVGTAVQLTDDASSLQTDIDGLPQLSPHASFTFWFWVSGIGVSGFNPSQTLATMTSEVAGGTDFFHIEFEAATSQIRLSSGNANFPVDPTFLYWPTPISDPDWHLVVISWDKAAGVWKLSVDGATAVTSALDGPPDPGADVESLILQGIDGQAFDSLGYKQQALTDTFLDIVWNSGDGTEDIGALFESVSSESVIANDVASFLLAHTRAATDAAHAADAATRLMTLLRAVTDAATFGNIATRIAVLLRSASDTATVSEAATAISSKDKTAVDSATVVDSAARLFAGFRSTSDSITASDAAAQVVAILRDASDAASFAEVASRIFAGLRTTTDFATFIDAAVSSTTSPVQTRTANDSTAFTDSAVATGGSVEERPQVGGKRRKLPRAARWSEYLGTPPPPPVVLALDKGTRLVPRLGLGALSFSPSYAPVPPIYAVLGSGSIDVNLALTAPISEMRLGNGAVTYSVNLEDDELAALLEMV